MKCSLYLYYTVREFLAQNLWGGMKLGLAVSHGLPTTLGVVVLLSPFERGDWGLERLGGFSKVTQKIFERTGVCIQSEVKANAFFTLIH